MEWGPAVTEVWWKQLELARCFLSASDPQGNLKLEWEDLKNQAGVLGTHPGCTLNVLLAHLRILFLVFKINFFFPYMN